MLLSTTGISVYKHYCGDFLASLSFYTPAESCSDMAEESCDIQKMDCCEDESEFYQADLDLIKNEVEQIHFSFYSLTITSFDLSPTLADSDNLKSRNYRAPPSHGPPTYILYSSLTYYG